MSVVCECPRNELCERCFAQAIDTLTGVARTRGYRWAADVARRQPDLLAQPWPNHERATAIAFAKVTDLSQDLRVLGRLADQLAIEATRCWEQLARR